MCLSECRSNHISHILYADIELISFNFRVKVDKLEGAGRPFGTSQCRPNPNSPGAVALVMSLATNGGKRCADHTLTVQAAMALS